MNVEIAGNAWRRERAWLGYAGLLPFLVCTGLLLAPANPALSASAVEIMRTYAAVIASFLGAIHWGVAMQDEVHLRVRLRWGVTPALIAWTLLLLPSGPAFFGFAMLFAAILFVDVRVLPLLDSSYRQLRMQLSTIVIACMLVAGLIASKAVA